MTREQWDREAATFDDEPDHGLADPATREVWRSLLLDVLPPPPARVADIGCGTGSLSRLLVDEGFDVEGLDFSPEMVERARAKVPEATFVVGDAADPPLKHRAFDVVLSRHVLWAMPDPEEAFARWVGLLRQGGRAVLVEGSWDTGAGLTAAECERIMAGALDHVVVRQLPESVYWGKEIVDERYLVTGRR
jgi:ubiquinone/menaquinone biosynthesis C-methylase UbiE